MDKTPRRLLCHHIRNAIVGFAFGIATLPIMLAVWPLLAAAMLWNDTDKEDD